MDNVLLVHFIGAGLAFLLGAVYSWLQCFISYHLLQLTCSRPMFWFRVVLATITTIFLVGSILHLSALTLPQIYVGCVELMLYKL